MLLTPKGHSQRTPSYQLRSSRFIDKDFQLKYTGFMLAAAALGTAVTILPSLYFLNQNYQIFVDLAYKQSPEILKYLERERSWLNSILVSGILGTLSFFWFLGLRITSRIVGPIEILKNHLHLLSRGHWDQQPVRTRNQDEFSDLVEAYNYFYHSFQVNLRRDLALLEKLSIDPENRDAYLAWKEMVIEKRQQLGIPASGPHEPIPASASASPPAGWTGQRHVS